MEDDNTAELIITPDGIVKNIVFAEELIQSAPHIPGWKFTALKPALPIENVCIKMEGYVYDDESLSFYSNEKPGYPDEIDLTIVHRDYKEEDNSTIASGVYIFLDNYLGELNAVTTIDALNIIGKSKAEKDLVPIAKLKDFLIWRQKEFLEKYEGNRPDKENDTYSMLESRLTNGNALIAIMNAPLLEWDRKASHPWVLKIIINYDGSKNNGMPDKHLMEILDNFETKISESLTGADGYQNIGRQTGDNCRQIYFACKDFRKPSKVLFEMTKSSINGLDIGYEIYKDKYWQSFEAFRSR